MEISVTLPADYPAVEPEIFVRSELLDKHQQAMLNKQVHDYISQLERGEICIYSAVSWLQENAHRFKQENIPQSSRSEPKSDTLVRLWIYSHHIYNSTKRKNISAWACQHGCTGFTLPGRPGIICLEGLEDDCEEVWKMV